MTYAHLDAIQIRPLRADDGRGSFRSGTNALDSWFARWAGRNDRLYGCTYVAVDDNELVGFVTVAASAVARTSLSEDGGGPTQWPVLLLARMAVAESRQRQDIGTRLLLPHVFTLALEQHDRIGCAAIVVDAKPNVVKFYEANQFVRTLDAPSSSATRMYLPIGTVQAVARQAVLSASP